MADTETNKDKKKPETALERVQRIQHENEEGMANYLAERAKLEEYEKTAQSLRKLVTGNPDSKTEDYRIMIQAEDSAKKFRASMTQFTRQTISEEDIAAAAAELAEIEKRKKEEAAKAASVKPAGAAPEEKAADKGQGTPRNYVERIPDQREYTGPAVGFGPFAWLPAVAMGATAAGQQQEAWHPPMLPPEENKPAVAATTTPAAPATPPAAAKDAPKPLPQVTAPDNMKPVGMVEPKKVVPIIVYEYNKDSDGARNWSNYKEQQAQIDEVNARREKILNTPTESQLAWREYSANIANGMDPKVAHSHAVGRVEYARQTERPIALPEVPHDFKVQTITGDDMREARFAKVEHVTNPEHTQSTIFQQDKSGKVLVTIPSDKKTGKNLANVEIEHVGPNKYLVTVIPKNLPELHDTGPGSNVASFKPVTAEMTYDQVMQNEAFYAEGRKGEKVNFKYIERDKESAVAGKLTPSINSNGVAIEGRNVEAIVNNHKQNDKVELEKIAAAERKQRDDIAKAERRALQDARRGQQYQTGRGGQIEGRNDRFAPIQRGGVFSSANKPTENSGRIQRDQHGYDPRWASADMNQIESPRVPGGNGGRITRST